MSDWAWFCVVVGICVCSCIGAVCWERWLRHKEIMAGVGYETEEDEE